MAGGACQLGGGASALGASMGWTVRGGGLGAQASSRMSMEGSIVLVLVEMLSGALPRWRGSVSLARMKKLLTTAAGLGMLCACAVHPHKIPDHAIYADEDDQLTSPDTLQFAVVGNLGGEPTAAMISDLRRKVDQKQLDFVLLMGDTVPRSTDKDWQAFDLAWREVLDGESIPTTEGYRVPALIVAGDQEYKLDKHLTGIEGAFPGTGLDIGYARVASWYHFDVRVEDEIWRFMVLDSGKQRMGSRWNEQMYWIPRATEGRYDNILLFMHDPVVSLGAETTSNLDGAPMELLETVEDSSGLLKVKAVFSAQAHTSELLLPDGNRGAAMFGAGGGGGGAEDLERWGNAVDLGYGDVQLEPLFDLKLQGDFDKVAQEQELSETVIEKAKATGSWEGFTGTYDADAFPLYGYWLVEITGEEMSATFRSYQGQDGFKDLYRIDFEDKKWRAGG